MSDIRIWLSSPFTELYREAKPERKEIYEKYLDHAREHKFVVDRFGRFPQRNKALARTTTADETLYLNSSN